MLLIYKDGLDNLNNIVSATVFFLVCFFTYYIKVGKLQPPHSLISVIVTFCHLFMTYLFSLCAVTLLLKHSIFIMTQ